LKHLGWTKSFSEDSDGYGSRVERIIPVNQIQNHALYGGFEGKNRGRRRLLWMDNVNEGMKWPNHEISTWHDK